MKRYLSFVFPFVFVVAGGLAIWWAQRPPDLLRGEPEDVGPLYDVHLEQPFVRVSGMAHYPIVIKQTVPGGLFGEDGTTYLFPLFPEHDTEDRAIRILVRANRPPEKYVSYEYMTVEGHVVLPTSDKVPFYTEIELGKRSNYFFTDEMLLIEAWRIEVDGEVWDRDAG